MSRFLGWETRRRSLEPAWLAVITSGQNLAGHSAIVMPRPPRPGQLAGLDVPALVVAGARSRAHDPATILREARARLPDVTTATLTKASHHAIPAEDTRELLTRLEPFLARWR